MEILRNIDKNIALKEFDRVLTEFEKSLGLNITLHDYTGMLYHLDEKRLFPNRNYHQCPYCMAGRFQEPGWRLFCVKDCQMISDTQLRKDPEPYLKTCWKGVIELVIPLISQKKVIAAAYVGAFKGEIPERSSIPEKYLKLYEQLVAFTSSLEGVGTALGKARDAYEDAYKRLCTGNDNIIRVGERLRRTARLQTKRQHTPRTLELAGSDAVEEAPAEIPEETPAPDGSGSRADVPTGTSESGTPTD